MVARHVATRWLLPALVIVLAVLAFTGCTVTGFVSPGGTFTVDYYDPDVVDLSNLQVVVVFDVDDEVDVGTDYVYKFPVGQYVDPFGDVQETRSFECHGVPNGDFFVYAFLDYDGDGVYEAHDPDYEVSWIYGQPNYGFDIRVTPYLITARYYPPVPNYTVTSSYAAPLEFTLLFVGT